MKKDTFFMPNQVEREAYMLSSNYSDYGDKAVPVGSENDGIF